MQFQTNLVRRDSRFYFRSRVPKDLKSHYGKNEILVSLKTSDKRVADYELAKIKVKIYADFARLRGEVFGFEFKSVIENQSLENSAAIIPVKSGPTIQYLIEYWCIFWPNLNTHSVPT